MNETKQVALSSKKHFAVLDGLRGIAAIAVVVFHFMEVAISDYSQNFIGHGFLAVDFFFCLSGFVIGYAYDDRIGKMGIMEFFKSRLIRLHPLVVLGSILGLIAFYADPLGTAAAGYSIGRIAMLFVGSIFLIPMPLMEDRYLNNFGLNAPAWSLFWEYIANMVYAFVLCRLKRGWLIVVALVFAVGICWLAKTTGNLMGGWSGGTFWEGGIRVGYSFTAGLLIWRYKLIFKNTLGFLGVGTLLLLALTMPYGTYNWLSEPFAVIIYFPLIVAIGAGTQPGSMVAWLCNFSGQVSYPLYMTHYMALFIFANYWAANKPGMDQLRSIILVCVPLLVLFSYAVLKLYDEPVRRYLTAKRKQTPKR